MFNRQTAKKVYFLLTSIILVRGLLRMGANRSLKLIHSAVIDEK